MRVFGVTLLVLAVVSLPLLLLSGIINLAIFFATGSLWLVASLVLILGPETITEVTIWKASIKRDVKAAKEIREDVEAVRNELRSITKLIAEDAYILASSSFLAIGGGGAAKRRLESNLEKLCEFAEPKKEKEDEWWSELTALYSSRMKSNPND